jgi:hypothetical protein
MIQILVPSMEDLPEFALQARKIRDISEQSRDNCMA